MAPESAIATSGSVESADGTRLAYRAWPKHGSLALAVVHGLGEHAGRYARFAEGMARHGMGTYALDLRGHGMSPGQRGHVDSWSQWTDDAAAFVSHIESIAGAEVVPVGHSFGGVTLLSTVATSLTTSSLSSPTTNETFALASWALPSSPASS